MRYIERFSSSLSETKIRGIFCQAKFGQRAVCSRCNSRLITKADSSDQWRCRKCYYQFRIQTGTFLAKKRIPLRLWYEIIYGFAIALPAHRLQKVLKTSDYRVVYGGYKTVRQALIQHSQEEMEKFNGITEVDESYFGGKFKNLRKKTRERLRELGLGKRGRGAKYRKQPVFGIYRRDGKIYLELVPDAQKPTLEAIIQEKIDEGGKIFSDTHTGYQGLVGLGYVHRTVNHGEEEYRRGNIHINGIEGFWGLSKTNMFSYKGIREKNWKGYLKEMEFRYNYRTLEYEDLVLKIIEIICQKVDETLLGS